MAIEIVDLPSYKMVIFHCYVSLPDGINIIIFVRTSLSQAGSHIKTFDKKNWFEMLENTPFIQCGPPEL